MFEVIKIIQASTPDGKVDEFSVLVGDFWGRQKELVAFGSFEEAKKAALDHLEQLQKPEA